MIYEMSNDTWLPDIGNAYAIGSGVDLSGREVFVFQNNGHDVVTIWNGSQVIHIEPGKNVTIDRT